MTFNFSPIWFLSQIISISTPPTKITKFFFENRPTKTGQERFLTISGTWRIILVSKWLVTTIYKPFSPFGRGITLLTGDLLTMVINHLLTGMILQVGSYRSCACALDSGTSGALAAPSWLARRLASQLSVLQKCGSGQLSGPRLGIRLEDC